MSMKTWILCLLAIGCGMDSAWGQPSPGPVTRAPAVQQPRHYDGIQAGLDAFRLAEEKRQAAITTQLGWNQFYRGQAAIGSPNGTIVRYGDGAWPLSAAQYSREFAYAFGRSEAVVWNGRGWRERRLVFESWPIVPGDIYGVIVQQPLRQPVGQWQGQTGPNRWESHPVYDPPLPEFRPLPEVDSPLLDETPFRTPRSEIQPRSKRPRER